MKRLLILTAVLLLALAAAGCVSEPASDKPVIAVSIVPEETFVKAVAGDLADIIVMIPPGSNPENYEPTPAQRQNLETASLYFAIGVPAESQILRLLPAAAQNKIIFLNKAAAEVYPELSIGDSPDPHVWLSPKRAAVMVETIAGVLADADPENQAVYQANAAAYIAELKSLETEIAGILEGAPQKTFIVYHPAFGYFAADFGLTQIALEDEGKEATMAHLMEMVDFAKANGIKVIFYQDEIDSSQAQAFAEEIGGKAVALSPLAADYAANLKTMAEAIANQ